MAPARPLLEGGEMRALSWTIAALLLASCITGPDGDLGREGGDVTAGGTQELAPAPGGADADTPCATIPADGRIVDDSEACFTAGGPPAYMRSATDAGYDDTLYWTHTTDEAAVANFGDWALDFDAAGTYQVEVYTTAAYAQSKQAHYLVTSGEMTEEITIDQTAVDGWQSLGNFPFVAGGHQGLELGDNTGEPSDGDIQLVFDAVRVTPVSQGSGSDDAGSGSGDMGSGGDGTTMTPGHGGCAAGGDSAGLGLIVLALGFVRRRRKAA
jgi:MYXO-CTERM domain-containing protein